jgi:hypothetical protein
MRYITLLAAFITSGMAHASPHAEGCLQKTWGYLKETSYEYGALNTCAYPVAVWFKPRNGRVVQSTVGPGEYFRSGLTIDKFETDRRKAGWVGAVCQADEVPDRTISDNTWDAILGGKYSCRKP